MPTAFIKSHLLQAFKLLWNTLLLASLAFSGLPLATAHAAPAKLPLPTGPVPSVTVGMDTYERTLIGENFSFYVDFSNTGAGVGYGPFIDLIFPTNGIDGAPNPDGISFVSATFGKNAYALPATTLTFPDGALATPPTPGRGCVNHPFAVDSTGAPLQICGTTGNTLVVLELPFSSVTPTMPGLDICVTAHISNLADVNTPLTILGRGGFRYGADNLDNPATDPVLVNPATTDGSGWSSLAVTPRVIYVSKDNSGKMECPYGGPSATSVLDPSLCPYGDVNPTYESVTGKNYPLTYTIEVDAAKDQTIKNLVVTDTLPNNIIIPSIPGVTASGGTGPTTITPPTYDILITTPNVLTVTFTSTTPNVPIVITIPFYIPQYQADNTTPIIDPTSGVAVAIDNSASAVGDWTPIDTRDSATPGNATADSGTNEINARSIAVQKSVQIWTENGPTGYSAGDVVQYKLDFQISDYFSFSTLKLDDVLSNGQQFTDGGGDLRPTFTVYDRIINPSGPVDSADITGQFTYTTPPAGTDELTFTPGADGSTTLDFNVSQAMTDIVPASTGVLQGGYTDGATSAQTAHGEIIFYAQVLEDFTSPIPTPTVVAHGDALTDKATVTGTIVDPAISATYGDITDESDQEFWIVNGDVTKHVYAVNGSTSFTKPAHIKPGDTITFDITQTLPSSDSYQYSVTDFVPLPILSVGELGATPTIGSLTPSATPPAAGQISLGILDTLHTTLPALPLPTISVDSAGNSVTFDYHSISDPLDHSTTIDLLYTLTMNNTPYADNATLSSLAFATEGTTNNGDFDYLDADQFVVMEPAMNISKGVVASSDSSIVFVPAPAAPVTFTEGVNPSWSGVIASVDNNPSTDIINSDAQQAAIGSTVTFAVVLENLGHSANGVFDVKVKDSLPTGMQIPTTGLGLNLQVHRGDGTVLSYSPVGAVTTDPSGLFDAGIAIANDTSVTPNNAMIAAYDATTGKNIIVISYDLTIASGLAASTQIVNTATELNYSSTLGGPDYVGNTPTANINSDDATLTLPDAAPVIRQGASTTVNMSENASPTPFSLALTAYDANGDPLTWSILSPAVYGSAGVGLTTGVVSYTPDQNYSGLDSFVVQVSDGRGGTDQINVNLKIDSVLVNSDLIWNQSYGIKYDSWMGVQDSNAFGGNYREAHSGVFTVKPPQLFTQFTWITYRGPDQGKARIYVDGKLMGLIDLYNATPNWQYPVVIKGLLNKPHTIVIKPMNARNPKSSDTWVVVDGFKVRTLTIDDNRIGISGLYSYGTWLGLVGKNTRFGHYRISSEKNANMQFSFLGTRFNWVTARGPQFGKALIYVDGLPVKTVDLYSANAQWQYRVAIQYLPYGNHVIQIKVLHTKNAASKGFGIICDGFEID